MIDSKQSAIIETIYSMTDKVACSVEGMDVVNGVMIEPATREEYINAIHYIYGGLVATKLNSKFDKETKGDSMKGEKEVLQELKDLKIKYRNLKEERNMTDFETKIEQEQMQNSIATTAARIKCLNWVLNR